MPSPLGRQIGTLLGRRANPLLRLAHMTGPRQPRRATAFMRRVAAQLSRSLTRRGTR